MRRWLALTVLLALARPALADDADTLTAQGEEQARNGGFTRAIELFKKADAQKPSAKHACLIALAYIRRELWSQAELFLDRCKQRATAADPLPDWFADATAQLAQKIAGVDVATVELRVEPEALAASVEITVSSFLPDETFTARTLHLSPGVYLFTARAPDGTTRTETATIKLGATNEVTLRFPQPAAAPAQPAAHAAIVESRPWRRERWLFAAAGASLAVGIVFEVLSASERSQLQDASTANDPGAWDLHSPAFDRDQTLASVGIGAAIAIAAGAVVVHYVRPAERGDATVIGGVANGGAFVGIEVRR